ncbi:hypothetical protein SESBI_37691 [Sesbania bispinosa]|nr:hypothetical protein SESBI_37691 [Sesbania bispinosa]
MRMRTSPYRVEELWSPDGTYRLRLTLEDSTARIHASVVAEDGVWCDVGYPRLVQRPIEIALTGKMSKRCACFEESQLGQPGLELYEGCDYHANRCKA